MGPDPEAVTWGLIEKSNEIEDVSAFLKEYPQGRFAPAARVRLQQLQRLASQQRTEEQPRLAAQERQRREREEAEARQRTEAQQRLAAQERQRREREEAEARQRAEAQRHQAQAPPPAPSAPTPQPLQVARLEPEVPKREEKVGRFIQYNNGTALDTKTNLLWMTKDFRNIEGRAPNNWDEAMAWAEKMNQQRYGGYSDWRVPTTAEYQAIYDSQATKRSYQGGKIGYPAVFEEGGGVWLWSAELATVGGYTSAIKGHPDPEMYGYDFRRGLVNFRKAHLDYSGDESIRLVRSGP